MTGFPELVPGRFGFLVLGAGRGGTSLLAALLDSHSRLAVGFERYAKDYLLGHALEGEYGSRFSVRAEAFRDACIAEARAFPDAVWGNKITTEQVSGLEQHNELFPGEPVDVLDRFFNRILERQRLLFILRDGRTCVRSKVARTGQSVADAERKWLYSVEVYRFLERHPRAMCIRYEALLQAPSATMEAVCRFLDVDYEPGMLAGTQHARINPDYRHDGFELGKLSLDGVPDGCEERLRPALRACGYL